MPHTARTLNIFILLNAQSINPYRSVLRLNTCTGLEYWYSRLVPWPIDFWSVCIQVKETYRAPIVITGLTKYKLMHRCCSLTVTLLAHLVFSALSHSINLTKRIMSRQCRLRLLLHLFLKANTSNKSTKQSSAWPVAKHCHCDAWYHTRITNQPKMSHQQELEYH